MSAEEDIGAQMHKQVLNHRFSDMLRSALLLLLVSFAFETEARAYTDPGTGALIWQMLVAGFVGFAFYFRRLRNWMKGKKNGAQRPAELGDKRPDL